MGKLETLYGWLTPAWFNSPIVVKRFAEDKKLLRKIIKEMDEHQRNELYALAIKDNFTYAKVARRLIRRNRANTWPRKSG